MQSTTNLYLKSMYLIYLEKGNVRVTDIANKLGYTKSSVSKALIKLKNKGLIEYEVYGDITLTKLGISKAEESISKENIFELFFIGVLNLPEDAAKKDIEIISDLVSNEIKNRLKFYISNVVLMNNKNCRCNFENSECKVCDKKLIKDRVDSNEKWVNILKEEK